MPWLVHLPKILLQITFFSCFWLSMWFTGSVRKSEWSPMTFLPCILANTSHSLDLFISTTSFSNWLVFYFYVHFWLKKKLKTITSGKLLYFWQQVERNKQQKTINNPLVGLICKWNDCSLSPTSLCQQFTF